MFEAFLVNQNVLKYLKMKEKRGDNTSSPISLSNTFYTKPDKKITYLQTMFVVFSLSTEQDEEYIDTKSRSNVFTLCIYTNCIQADPKVFQTNREFTHLNIVNFSKWFLL